MDNLFSLGEEQLKNTQINDATECFYNQCIYFRNTILNLFTIDDYNNTLRHKFSDMHFDDLKQQITDKTDQDKPFMFELIKNVLRSNFYIIQLFDQLTNMITYNIDNIGASNSNLQQLKQVLHLNLLNSRIDSNSNKPTKFNIYYDDQPFYSFIMTQDQANCSLASTFLLFYLFPGYTYLQGKDLHKFSYKFE